MARTFRIKKFRIRKTAIGYWELLFPGGQLLMCASFESARHNMKLIVDGTFDDWSHVR